MLFLMSFMVLNLSILGSIRGNYPNVNFSQKRSFAENFDKVFVEHDDWSFGDKLEEMEIDEDEVIATNDVPDPVRYVDLHVFPPAFDIDHPQQTQRTQQIVHKAKRVRYRRKGQNGRRVVGVVKSAGSRSKNKNAPSTKADNNTVITDKKYGIVGSPTKTMPCCTESIGNYACSLMRNKNPLKFKNRCRNDADFGIIQCCRSCNTNVVELGSILFASGLRSKHCFDRHNRRFCAHFVYQSGMWAANQRKQLNCDGESASLAFRICRRSCGFCDPELYQSPNISPNCSGIMAGGVDSSGRIATVNSTTTTPAPLPKLSKIKLNNETSTTPDPLQANNFTTAPLTTVTAIATTIKSMINSTSTVSVPISSTSNSTYVASSAKPSEMTTLSTNTTDYPQPYIISIPTIPKITIIWRKMPPRTIRPAPPPPNPIEVVGPVPELPEIPFPELPEISLPETESTEFPEWPYPLPPINVIENILDEINPDTIDPNLLEKILPTPPEL